jgi:hypothetical protein
MDGNNLTIATNSGKDELVNDAILGGGRFSGKSQG